jgi:shikimate dehydrogenase
VLDAKKRGIKSEGGLFMLVMQAVVAVERFLDTEIEKSRADGVYRSVIATKENVVLTGMPGSGKSTVGKLLKIDGYDFFDIDDEIEKRCGCSIKELIESKGEGYFRDLESEVIRDVSAESGRIISTGGGAILREENVRALKRNGRIFFIDAPHSRLSATSSRPLSDTEDKLKRLYDERIDIYRSTSDVTVSDMQTPEEESQYILSKRMELSV